MNKLKDLTDFLTIGITKDEIASGDIFPTLKTLNSLLVDNETILHFFQRVEIGISGYDEDNRELWDIPEVRVFIQRLDEKFPYWFYFLTNLGSGLMVVSFCCNNLIKLTNTQVWVEPASMEKFYNDHFIAMNFIGARIGMTNQENKDLTEIILKYFS